MMKKRLFLLLIFLGSSIATLHAANCQQIRTLYNCPSTEKYPIHLSFDDGPSPQTTPKILDALKRHQVKATFFVLAEQIDCLPLKQRCSTGNADVTASCTRYKQCLNHVAIVNRAIAEGHMIGSHSYSHARHSQLAATEMNLLIKKSKNLLQPYFTTSPPVFRLPYGDGWFNRKQAPHVLQAIEKHGFKHIAWNMSAFDWREADQQGDAILKNAMTQICQQKHGTILFHDGDFKKNHIGRTFTAAHMDKWLDAMRCVVDFKPLTDAHPDLTIHLKTHS